MPQKLNRRDFAMAGTAWECFASTSVLGAGPQILQRRVKPVVVSPSAPKMGVCATLLPIASTSRSDQGDPSIVIRDRFGRHT